MAASFWKICHVNLAGTINSAFCISIRNGHHLRGKPPGIAKSLDQKLTGKLVQVATYLMYIFNVTFLERNYKDPALHFRVDIGLPPHKQNRSKELKERLSIIKAQRKNPAVEKLARSKDR